MSLDNKVFRSSLLKLKPYRGGKGKPDLGDIEIHKLSSNENPYGCSDLVTEAIAKEIKAINQYPDQTDLRLRKALELYYNQELGADQFITANGGVEIIEILVEAFLDSTSNCIVSNPCFLPYIQFSEKVGARVIDVPLKSEDYSLDVTGILNAITPDTRIIWLCSPNNPSGTYIKRQELKSIIQSIPDHVLLVYDEVYFHYTDIEDYTTALPYVLDGKNVIAINSFSKAHGMAGMRVGYAYSTTQIASYINNAKRPFYVNRLGMSGAIAALQDDSFINNSVQQTQKQRRVLLDFFEKLGIEYWPSQANFFMIDPEMPTSEFESKMATFGVMVRPADPFGAPGKVRVTIGSSANNIAFMSSCREVLGK